MNVFKFCKCLVKAVIHREQKHVLKFVRCFGKKLMHWQHSENKLMSKQKCSCNNTFASEPKEAVVKIEQNQQNQSYDRRYGFLAKKLSKLQKQMKT